MRPRRRLGLSRGGEERESHCRGRADPVAAELPRVGDACVRGEARTKRDHPLERCERGVVAPEFDLRVADDAVRSVRAGQQLLGTTAVRQCGSELVLDERERPQSEHGVRVVVPEAERASQRRLGAREVRGVRRLTPAQLVREAELDEKLGVMRAGVHRCFQSAHPCRADSARRSGERVLDEHTGSGGGCRHCRARLGEHASDEAPEGERDRNRAAHEDCRSSSHVEPRLRPTGVPCGRSPGSGPRRRGTSRGTGCRRSYPPRHPRCCSESGSRSRRRTRSS